jgi:hypothetical protein
MNDLTDKTFHRLTVLSRAANAEGSRQPRYNVICDCGTERIVSGHNLRNGVTRSCGCLRSEAIAARSTCAARAVRVVNGTPVGNGLYKWGQSDPKTMGEICRIEKVDYLMVWRKSKTIGLKKAVCYAKGFKQRKTTQPT